MPGVPRAIPSTGGLPASLITTQATVGTFGDDAVSSVDCVTGVRAKCPIADQRATTGGG
jgi:hypothetical protein